ERDPVLRRGRRPRVRGRRRPRDPRQGRGRFLARPQGYPERVLRRGNTGEGSGGGHRGGGAAAGRALPAPGRRPERAVRRGVLPMSWKGLGRGAAWIVGGAFAVGAVALLSFCVALRSERGASVVQVPDWSGRSRDEAMAQAKDLGLGFEVAE